MYWQPGYCWNTENTRGVDVGETPDDVLAIINFARWISGADYMNLDNLTFRIRLAGGQNWNAYGAGARLAVVAPDGQNPNISGRYHLDSRPLAIGTLNEPGLTTFSITSSNPSNDTPNWRCSWLRDGVPLSQGTYPLLTHVESFAIALVGYTRPPVGVFALKEMSAAA